MLCSAGTGAQYGRLGCSGAAVFGVLVAWLLSGSIAAAQMAPAEALPARIGTLKEYRVKAEHWAALLKGMQAEGGLSKSEYRQGETYYVEAKAGVDNWLERLLTELETGGNTDLSEDQKRALEETALKAHRFMEYVAAFSEDQERGGWVTIIPDAITNLVDAGIKVWHEIQSPGREKREALIKRLEGVRWLAFDEIQPK